MTIIAVPPTVRFTNFDIWCDAVSEEFTSSFNGQRQVAKKPFDVWGFVGDLVPLDANDAGSVRSFLMQLAGKVNTFKLKIAGSKYPVSNYKGPNGAMISSAANYVLTGGLTTGLVLKEGDYFNIGNELKVATANANAGVDGQAFIYFMPPLRNVTPGQVVTITDPFLYLHATDDKIARWKVSAPVRHAFKIEAEEEIA